MFEAAVAGDAGAVPPLEYHARAGHVLMDITMQQMEGRSVERIVRQHAEARMCWSVRLATRKYSRRAAKGAKHVVQKR